MPISTTRTGTGLARLAGGLLALTALLLVPALPAIADDPGDTTVGVATRPAGSDGVPDNRTRFTYTADAGQTITDQVYIGNTGTEAQEFTVFATDGYNTDAGEFGLLATDETPSDIGTWLTFENGENRIRFSLQPDEARMLTFTVAVPADATPGDHVGGLVASVVQDGTTVSLDRRVATAIYARISGELQPRLTIASLDAHYDGDWWFPFGGTVTVDYTVHNPGNVALAANVDAGASSFFWIPVAKAAGDSIPVLLPGSTATYRAQFTAAQWLYLSNHVKLQPYADSDDPDIQLLQVAPTSRDTVLIVRPWTILIALALVAGVVALVRWRRRRQDALAVEWMEQTERRAREEAERAVSSASETREDAVTGA